MQTDQGHWQPPAAEPPPWQQKAAAPARGHGWIAWIALIALIVGAIVMTRLSGPLGEPGEDPVGLTIFQLQAKYIVGWSGLLPENAQVLYAQSKPALDMGTLQQRQRFIVVAAELSGPWEARRLLEELDDLIQNPRGGEPIELSEPQASIQRILHELYPSTVLDLDEKEAAAAVAGTTAGLESGDRRVLKEDLGWFGELALAPAETADAPARDAVLRPARVLAFVLVSVAVAAIGAGLAGFASLVVFIVFLFLRRLSGGLGAARGHHQIYAETFAVWLMLFLGLQILAEFVSPPGGEMLVVIIMFLASLVALGWPRWRGIPWRQVRADIGLTLGRAPLLEPGIGVVGYLATLPLLMFGLLITMGLMAIQGALGPEPSTFAPSGPPAHPVIVQMGGSDIWPKIQVLFLAAVVAPIVEETMFRGVLYRHLRDATGRFGMALSVAVSVLANTFLFAVIHPQGFVAIPALMSLAMGMTLVREWRGSLIPSMVIHGVSNGLIISMLLIMLAI